MENRPYGTWPSPISADLAASAYVSFGELASDGNDLYFLESRPSERGRTALMLWRSNEECFEVTNDSYDVRSMVHEYGGGAYTVAKGTVFFCQQVGSRYLQSRSSRKDDDQATDKLWTRRTICRFGYRFFGKCGVCS